MLEEKRSREIKYKQKKGKEDKAPTEAESTGQFEEKMNEKIEKKEKVKKERSHDADSTSRVSKRIEGSAMDGRKEKKNKKKRKKEDFGSDGSVSTSMVTRDMEESEVDMAEKKNNKRKRVVDGKDLGNKEKRSMRMSEGNSASLDKDIHDNEMGDLSHVNLKKKKKGKNLRDAGAIELEEGIKKQRRDDKLQDRGNDKYEVEKKMKMKKKSKSGSCIEKEINEEEEKAEYMGKEEEDKQIKEGSKKNKRVKKASKSEEKDESENKGKQKETAAGNNEAKNDKNKKERKKVHFSDEVKVFSTPSDSEQKTKHKKTEKRNESEGVVWGTRFTKEEDMILLKAIDDYIQVSSFNSLSFVHFPSYIFEVAWCSFALKN
jgi:hypothetical protein